MGNLVELKHVEPRSDETKGLAEGIGLRRTLEKGALLRCRARLHRRQARAVTLPPFKASHPQRIKCAKESSRRRERSPHGSWAGSGNHLEHRVPRNTAAGRPSERECARACGFARSGTSPPLRLSSHKGGRNRRGRRAAITPRTEQAPGPILRQRGRIGAFPIITHRRGTHRPRPLRLA